MSSAADIQQRIKDGRSQEVDWLAGDASLPQIVEALVALANSSGGTLLLGIDDDTTAGVEDKVAASDKLIEAAFSAEPPLIIPLPQIIAVEETHVIQAQIPAGMPHVYAYNGRYLIRKGTENTPLNPRDLRRLMMERGEMSFETNPAQGASLQDIDWDKAREYARSLSGFGEDDVQQVLLKRGCLLQQGDDLLPTHAGILLFGKDPQRFVVGSDMSAVRFGGEDMGDTFSRQDITGTLPEQIKRAETFLVDHLRKEITLKDTMKREENYEYPMEAARELVINAVAHRDYSVRGDNIRLFIFGNRMEIHSPGGLPGHMTLANLRDERFSRNPVIVQVLADMNYIEKLGYGVDRVLELMQAQNLRAPEFEERTGGFRVLLHNAAVKPLPEKKEDPKPEAEEKPLPPVTQFNGLYNDKEINPRQEAALAHLLKSENSRITNSDLSGFFPDVHPETIRRDLVDLVNKKILVKRGQKRGSYYVMKPQKKAKDTEALSSSGD